MRYPNLAPVAKSDAIGGVKMNKKWTIEKIRDFVAKNSDSQLLSTEYVGFSQKLQFKCSCGNTFEKTFTKFKGNNQRSCSECVAPRPSR